MTSSPSAAPAGTRAGIVALVGLPNAGKSTLLNAFLGEKLSIVTPKAQTTWRRVTGIHTSSRAQAIFVDTPGLLVVRDLLQRAMLEEAREALRDADLAVLVVDATRSLSETREAVSRGALLEAGIPLLTAVNKSDAAEPARVQELVAWASETLGSRCFVISAALGTGVAALLEAIEDALPPSPFLYDAEDLAIQPERFFVSELIRETVFEQFDEEVPYSVFCTIEEFREGHDPVYIRAVLHTERATQKAILIGEGGRAIRRLGQAAREKTEALLGRPVYLDLWVKALPRWRRKRGQLSRFGFRVPEDAPADG